MPALRVLLVGEDNPQHSDPYYALYPEPAGCSGARLMAILGAPSKTHYLRRTHRYNLCTGRWCAVEARRRAYGLKMLYWPNPKVLLGRKVQAAFDLRKAEPFFIHRPINGEGPMLCLPHPSGRCRAWNDPRALTRARAALEELSRG